MFVILPKAISRSTNQPIRIMATQAFDEKQGLDIIRKMIDSSRKNYSETAWYFLVWGWVILAASLIHYAVIQLQWTSKPGLVWFSLIALGSLYTVIRSIREERSSGSRTFVDYCLAGLWMGSSGMFLISILLGLHFSWYVAFPVFMAVYGWGTFTSGIILKFRPLIAGGLISFVIAALSVFVQSQEILLLLALSLLCSYLIPGYMLLMRK